MLVLVEAPEPLAGASPGSAGAQTRQDVPLDRPDAPAEEESEIARQAREARERRTAEAARAAAELERCVRALSARAAAGLNPETPDRCSGRRIYFSVLLFGSVGIAAVVSRRGEHPSRSAALRR